MKLKSIRTHTDTEKREKEYYKRHIKREIKVKSINKDTHTHTEILL